MNTEPAKVPGADYDLVKIVREYFDTVTPEQLAADLKAADFDHWNRVGDNAIDPESIRGLTLTRESFTVQSHS